MKYFKYIIILVLLLISILLYIQLEDYDRISNSLLTDNSKTKIEMEQLANSIDEIKEQNLELQEKINILYTIIDTREIEIELLEESCIDHNKTEDINSSINPTEQQIENSEPNTTKITLENENEVTRFE